MNARYIRDKLTRGLISLSTVISLALLVIIIGFIFIKGLPMVNYAFITGNYESSKQYVQLTQSETLLTFEGEVEDEIYMLEYATSLTKEDSLYMPEYGLSLCTVVNSQNERILVVDYVHPDSPANYTENSAGTLFPLEKGYEIDKIDSTLVADYQYSLEEIAAAFVSQDSVKIRAIEPGGGIWPMILTTLMLIGLSLLIAIPVGVFAAIYLVEYAKPGRLVNIIRFATESLAGIPSIVYGLFGMLFFVKMVGVQESILAGALTVSIILLPTVIRTTEETLKTVPQSYKEASFGLGANRLQTLRRVILPSAIPGILVAVILSIGRIVGESAALLFTMGTFAKVPSGFTDSGATLTVRAYMEVKEYGNVEMAAGIGVVLMLMVLILNFTARTISSKLTKQ
jgi:phosphate transport system permease protein